MSKNVSELVRERPCEWDLRPDSGRPGDGPGVRRPIPPGASRTPVTRHPGDKVA